MILAALRRFFELCNDACLAVGSGFVGMLYTLTTRSDIYVLRGITLVVATAGGLYFLVRSVEKAAPARGKVVLVTGCDSGLGFSLAKHCHSLGMTVIAACLSNESEGAKLLRKVDDKQLLQIQLNITNPSSISTALDYTEDYLSSHPGSVFWALVNNAGVMVFGEFEWLTDKLIDYQLAINLAGTMKMTKAFCPLLRKHKGRIITIGSHCAYETLPGLAVYGASKAALAGWCDALRVELAKYGVRVVHLVPGSLTQQTNIMASQEQHALEMQTAMSQEQSRFYADYFQRYNNYLRPLGRPRALANIADVGLYETFEAALLQARPRAVYVHEPLRYTVYNTLFRLSPVWARDWLVVRFMQMPDWMPASDDVLGVVG